jgi:hypothetical protein
MGSIIPGFLEVDINTEIAIRAGGAIGLFVIIYLIKPPELVREQALRKSGLSAISSGVRG